MQINDICDYNRNVVILQKKMILINQRESKNLNLRNKYSLEAREVKGCFWEVWTSTRDMAKLYVIKMSWA